MFGKQAIRLIREAWGGILHPDGAGVMRERGANQLAQELYSMFDSNIPLEHNAPITIHNAGAGPSLTIENTSGTGAPALAVNGPSSLSGNMIIEGDNITIGTPRTMPPLPPWQNGPWEPQKPCDPTKTPELCGEGVWMKGPVDFEEEPTIGGQPMTEVFGGGGGGGGGALMGIVTGGSDQEYDVDVYGDGYDEDSTSSLEGVKAPDVLTGETLDVGAHVPVFAAGGNYYIFPPVWL